MRSDDAVEWSKRHLLELIEIESYSKAEHAVADRVESLAAELGLPVRRQAVPGAADNILVGSGEPELLLTAHMDTITPTWGWTGRAVVDGDLLYGLGAQDDKGSIVACLLAALMARDAGVELADLPVLLGFTVDEEQDGTGSAVLADLLRPRHVIALEGTGMQIANAEAGTVEAYIDVYGTAVHASMPELGDNAIHKAVELVTDFRGLPIVSRSTPGVGTNHATVRQMSGGGGLSVVPDHARVHVEVRVAGVGEAHLVQEELEALSARYGAKFDLVETVEPFVTDRGSPVVRFLRNAVDRVLGGETGFTVMPAWTDAHSFAEAGSEAVVFGPGTLLTAHRPDERISLTELVDSARVLADILLHAAELA
jgi:acetylornithine deacetylase/succinyl-diaminopimelate desuccinylase-like protein